MTTKQPIDTAAEIDVAEFGSVENCLVLAPHPDDEALGCGGLIAMLREQEKEVHVLFTTDGSLSHPNSKKYPPESLAALRRTEAKQALSFLGVPESKIIFFNKKDGSLPAEREKGFEQNANQLHLIITLLQPDLVLVPYEKDPHRDHRATWQMLAYAHRDVHASYRILEYMVWLMERGEEADLPATDTFYYLDISACKARKQQAIRAHVSQTTKLIDDDPQGFTLSQEMLQRFDTNKEYYINRNL